MVEARALSPEGEIDGVPAHQRVEATVPGSAAQQYRIEKFSYQRDHDVGSAAQFMAVAFDEPHRPAHPLQFLTVLGNQRPMSDGLPFGDELVFGAHECHPWTSQRRDGISLRPVPNTSVKRRVGVSPAAARCDFRDRERLPILSVERRPTATDQRRQPIRSGGELQPTTPPQEKPNHANLSALAAFATAKMSAQT